MPIESSLKKRVLLFLAFCFYAFLLFATILQHEPWGDEVHSWNIAKCSSNILDLLSNIRYEGHPPAWYVILWTISKFTRNLLFIQIMHGVIACVSVMIILFFSPFPLKTRLLLPFGYYFLYEYGVLSRNYALGIVLALGICLVTGKEFKGKQWLYYILLFALANVHLLAAFLAISLHTSLLVEKYHIAKNRIDIIMHLFLGTLVIYPSIYLVFPPSDSGLNISFWVNSWQAKQLLVFLKAPLSAFVPIPAWWEYNFWNTNFLLRLDTISSTFKYLNALLSLSILALCTFIFKNNRIAIVLFLMNAGLTFFFALIFPTNDARYVGYLYLGFVMAIWFLFAQGQLPTHHTYIINTFLTLQLLPTCFVFNREFTYPFSNGFQSKDLLSSVPKEDKLVTDYWCLNYLSAFNDQSYYCIDLMEQKCFLMWDTKTTIAATCPSPYAANFKQYLEHTNTEVVYFVTTLSEKKLRKRDTMLIRNFNVTLFDKKDSSIQQNSNLYLYKVEKR